ncbi:PH domain-containing protein (plasmid) [Staphylococcus epidermidis]|uniref:PH domain-containing protein n=1 Tax=Staphylococcus epidermidis TaxID=1282 RepID=UPI0024ACD509|nr:PH domain-containing protein [Staphylococcus epidermidis]WHI82635.1 PH domain-containing protein [Staphylococcus epidermidis]
MTNNFKRLSKYWMIYRFWEISKTTFFLFIFFQLISKITPIPFIYLAFILSIYSIFEYSTIYIEWKNFKYKLSESNFTLIKGRLFKTEKTFSKSQVQNISSYAPFLHRIFGLQMCVITLGSSGDKSTVKLSMLNDKETNHILNYLSTDNDEKSTTNDKKIIYTTNLKEIIIGSLSLTKIIIFSTFLYSINNNIKKHFGFSFFKLIEQNIKNFENTFLTIIFLAIIYYMYSLVKNYMLYGNYIVQEYDNLLYLSRGVIDKNSVVIDKSNIKGINIKYSPIQKIFGICQIDLIFTSNDIKTKNNNTSVLLPFVNIKKSQHIISNILPNFCFNEKLTKLPKKSMISIFLKSLHLLLILIILFYINFLNFRYFYLALIIFIVFVKVASPFINSYFIDGKKVIFKKLNLRINLFITNTYHIEEINITQNFIQQILKLCKISIVNKKDPYIYKSISDIPLDKSEYLIKFYKDKL